MPLKLIFRHEQIAQKIQKKIKKKRKNKWYTKIN